MSHPETNPHFVRPLQQPDGISPHFQPPPTSPAPKLRARAVEPPYEPQDHQNEPPLPRGVRPQGQRSRPQGPRGRGYEIGGLFQAPQPKTLPTDRTHHPEYHTPWLIPSQHPAPQEEIQVRDPKPDGEYRSPWMSLPPHQNEQLQEPRLTRERPERPQEPQYFDFEDHYPLHPRDPKPSPKPARKKPQRQRSQPPDRAPVPQPKPQDRDTNHEQDHHPLNPRDTNREQDHHPLNPRDPKPSPSQQQRRRSQVPASQRTGALTWLIAAFCALFWILVFLGGLIVLILYLVYRPRSPKFDISSATLNAAYIDAGALLNADITILTNFTNPNKKAGVEFSHMIIDLYYGNILIATQYTESFSVPKAHSMFANLHMVTSQVRLPLGEVTRLQEETNRNAIMLNVKGVFRVRSNLGSFLRYSYRLYSHCTIMMSAPPSGVLRAFRCKTKR